MCQYANGLRSSFLDTDFTDYTVAILLTYKLLKNQKTVYSVSKKKIEIWFRRLTGLRLRNNPNPFQY